MRSVRVIVKAALFVLWSLLLAPLQYLYLKCDRGPRAYLIPWLWERGMCRVFGLRVVVEGTPLRDRQTLFVSNHISYLDIPVLGSLLKASFVAKKDVAAWPVFGTLARLQQTAFVSRARIDAHRETNALGNMLDESKSLILFPEGTSTDGRIVEPFKSSMFAMIFEETRNHLTIQPVTLVIDSVDGRSPDDQAVRETYAWSRDMTIEMPPHLRLFAATRGATIRVIFHPPIDPAAFADRKALAEACHAAVQSGLAQQNLAAGLAA